jgi:hypothetical protein
MENLFCSSRKHQFLCFSKIQIARNPSNNDQLTKNRWYYVLANARTYIGTCQIPGGSSNPNDEAGFAKSSLRFGRLGWPKTYHNLFKSHSLPVPTVKFKFHFFIIHTFPLTGKQHKIKKINSHITHSNNAKLNDIYIIRMREEAENLNIFSKNKKKKIKSNSDLFYFVFCNVVQQ